MSTPDTLLVLGAERRHGIRIRFRFSFSSRLAASAPGPVALVPEGSSAAGGPVVAGVDGSEGSHEAVLLGAEEAERAGVELVVVHVWSEGADWESALPFDTGELPELEAGHRAILDGAVQLVQTVRPWIPVYAKLVHARPVRGLLDMAASASLLVLGKHSRADAGTALLGSVSHSALLSIATPTLIAARPRQVPDGAWSPSIAASGSRHG
jgi:nucleotide-binding universal stress UspA family protein